MEAVTEAKAALKQPHVPPERQLLLQNHLYLPHERMLYAVDSPGPLRLLNRGDNVLQVTQLTGKIFPKSFAEIYPKTFLRKAIDGMVAGIVKQVSKLNPRTFLAGYAPLHSIEEAWRKKNGGQLEPDVRLANSKATGTPMDVDGPVLSPPILSKKTRIEQRAALEAEQIIRLKEYLSKNSTENLEMAHLATSVHDVYALLRGYCVVALDRQAVFGSRRNEKAFQRILRRYLQLGIADKMHVEMLVHSIDKEEIPWLKRAAKHNHDMFVAEFFLWIFSEVINALIRRLFYVTASQSGRKERLFFRRDIWNIVCTKAEQEYVESKLWHQLSSEPINEKNLGDASELSMFLTVRRNMQPVFITRFIPREVSGVRPIMVRERSRLHGGSDYVTQLRIRNAGLLLQYLIQRDKRLGGFHRSTTIDVQQGWSQFRQHRLQTNDQRPLYFVTCDIEKAYDNVHLGILRKLLDRLYHQCQAEEMDFFFLYDFKRDAAGQVTKMALGSGPRFRLFSKAEDANFAEKDQYATPMVVSFEQTFKDVDFMAQRAVFRSLKKKVWFTFLRGIPQGGPLSSLFLQLYLGALENEMGLAVSEEELMMRYMDDILYVSPHPNKVRKFLALVLEGYPAAGVTFNPKKTYTNLPLNLPNLMLAPISQQGVRSVSWYGWMFSLTQDLSLKVGMRRYHAFRLRYMASISYSSPTTLRRSLTFSLMGKFAMALFDLHCGPLAACTENVYEMFVLCAMDLLAYWRTGQKVQRKSQEVLRMLQQMAHHLGRMLASRQTFLQQEGPLKDAAGIEALAWLAFATVFCLEGRKSSPLSRACRRRIEHKAMQSLVNCLARDGEKYSWIVPLITDTDKRFPITFRSIPL